MKSFPSWSIYLIALVLLFFAILGVRALLVEPEIMVDSVVIEKIDSEAIVKEGLQQVTVSENRDDKPINRIVESNVDSTKQGMEWFYRLNFQKARESFDASRNSDPVSRFYLALIDSYEDKHEEAKSVLKDIINENTSPELVLMAKEVLTAYNTFLLYRDSSTDFLYVLLGKAYINTGQVTLAIVKLKQALALNNEYADAWILLASSFILTGNYDEAEKALTQVPSDRPEIAYYLALAKKEQGKYEESIITFQKALERGFKPIDEVYLQLGDTYLALGKTETALTYYLDAIQKSPQDLEYYRKALWMHIQIFKNLDTALGLAQQMLDKNLRSPEAHAYVAWVALEKDDPTLAKKYIDSGFSLMQESAALYYYRGLYYEKIGKTKNAEVDLKKAMELDIKGIFKNALSEESN